MRWYVDTRVGRQVRASPGSGCTPPGRAYFIFLWAQERWGVHLWGRHTIEARFQVEELLRQGPRGCGCPELYFNHDPRPDDPIFAH